MSDNSSVRLPDKTIVSRANIIVTHHIALVIDDNALVMASKSVVTSDNVLVIRAKVLVIDDNALVRHENVLVTDPKNVYNNSFESRWNR